jgi:hypothetical protein
MLLHSACYGRLGRDGSGRLRDLQPIGSRGEGVEGELRVEGVAPR